MKSLLSAGLSAVHSVHMHKAAPQRSKFRRPHNSKREKKLILVLCTLTKLQLGYQINPALPVLPSVVLV